MLIGVCLINHPFWGTPIYGSPQVFYVWGPGHAGVMVVESHVLPQVLLNLPCPPAKTCHLPKIGRGLLVYPPKWPVDKWGSYRKLLSPFWLAALMVSHSYDFRFVAKSSALFRETLGQPRQALQCPITREFIADPVLAGDGYTYERQSIEQHWANQLAGWTGGNQGSIMG